MWMWGRCGGGRFGRVGIRGCSDGRVLMREAPEYSGASFVVDARNDYSGHSDYTGHL